MHFGLLIATNIFGTPKHLHDNRERLGDAIANICDVERLPAKNYFNLEWRGRIRAEPLNINSVDR